MHWETKKIHVTRFIAILDLVSEVCLYLKETKSLSQRDSCTPMFTAALFTIAKTWKQPKCPSTDEWIKKM